MAIPYAIGYKKDKIIKTFYIDNFNRHEDRTAKCLDDILNPNNHNIKFYIYNLSNFDSLFLLRVL